MESWKIGPSEGSSDPKMIPTRFKQSIDREAGKLNSLTPQAKVVAAISKALAIQGQRDGKSYYLEGDELYCPQVTVLDTKDEEKKVFQAAGRCVVGRLQGEDASNFVIEFDIRFADSEDSMGLPDIKITEATMEELDKTAPLNPSGE